MTLRRPSQIWAVIALGVIALSLAACDSGHGDDATPRTSGIGSSSGRTLRLGFIGALVGAEAQLGINIEDGEKLAVSQYGTTKPAVKVVVDAFDSGGNVSRTKSGATELINDKVVAVITPALPAESAVADATFESAGIPNVSASVTAVTLAENGWKFFHRVVADDGAQGRSDADYLVKNRGDKTVAVIDDSSTYGAGLANAVRATLKTNGGFDILDEHVNPIGGDFESTVEKILVAKPSGVFFGGYYLAAGRLVNQLRSAGYKGAFMSGDGSEDPNFVRDAGGAPAEGAFLSCACDDTATNTNAETFNAAYRAAFGTAPGTYSAEAYDATNFLLSAIKSGATTPSAINDYLASNSYTGVTKTIKFQPDGDLSSGTIYVYEIQKGKIMQIGTTN